MSSQRESKNGSVPRNEDIAEVNDTTDENRGESPLWTRNLCHCRPRTYSAGSPKKESTWLQWYNQLIAEEDKVGSQQESEESGIVADKSVQSGEAIAKEKTTDLDKKHPVTLSNLLTYCDEQIAKQRNELKEFETKENQKGVTSGSREEHSHVGGNLVKRQTLFDSKLFRGNYLEKDSWGKNLNIRSDYDSRKLSEATVKSELGCRPKKLSTASVERLSYTDATGIQKDRQELTYDRLNMGDSFRVLDTGGHKKDEKLQKPGDLKQQKATKSGFTNSSNQSTSGLVKQTSPTELITTSSHTHVQSVVKSRGPSSYVTEYRQQSSGRKKELSSLVNNQKQRKKIKRPSSVEIRVPFQVLESFYTKKARNRVHNAAKLYKGNILFDIYTSCLYDMKDEIRRHRDYQNSDQHKNTRVKSESECLFEKYKIKVRQERPSLKVEKAVEEPDYIIFGKLLHLKATEPLKSTRKVNIRQQQQLDYIEEEDTNEQAVEDEESVALLPSRKVKSQTDKSEKNAIKGEASDSDRFRPATSVMRISLGNAQQSNKKEMNRKVLPRAISNQEGIRVNEDLYELFPQKAIKSSTQKAKRDKLKKRYSLGTINAAGADPTSSQKNENRNDGLKSKVDSKRVYKKLDQINSWTEVQSKTVFSDPRSEKLSEKGNKHILPTPIPVPAASATERGTTKQTKDPNSPKCPEKLAKRASTVDYFKFELPKNLEKDLDFLSSHGYLSSEK